MSTLIVVPCSGLKLDRPAPAGLMYRGSLHMAAQRAAEALAHRIEADGRMAERAILSAKHGLLDLGQRIDPYDVTWGQPEAITVDDVAGQLVDRLAEEVVSLCPRDYTAVLVQAAQLAAGELIPVHAPLAGSPSIFEIRSRLKAIREGGLDPLGDPVPAR